MLNIAKYLYLLRKIYLTRYFRKSYSQFGEDVALLSLLGKDKLRGYRGFFKGYPGFFVDVGCYHPVKHSNTYVLYKRGWRGINIDIDQLKIDGFNIVRKKDINIVAGVSSDAGMMNVYKFGKYSLLTTLDKKTAEKYQNEYGKEVTVEEIQTRSLTDIIDSTRYKGQIIDVLTIDAEGHDYEVISSLDFDRYQPRVVLAESHERELGKVLQTRVHRFLEGKGYSIVNWVGFTLFYSSMPVDEMHIKRNQQI